MTPVSLHPIVVAAAGAKLPGWARVRHERLAHMARVAELLGRWAQELGLGELDERRWVAAGWLHDALRDADPAELAAEADGFPAELRHGPAAARRLRRAGVADEELLEAIAFHSLGRAGLRPLGRFLFLADYLEPGRDMDPQELSALRARLPRECDAVLKVVCARRIEWLLESGRPLRPETVEFWNEVVAGS
jgi:HD superfamily phosphohydrolase YqeK